MENPDFILLDLRLSRRTIRALEGICTAFPFQVDHVIFISVTCYLIPGFTCAERRLSRNSNYPASSGQPGNGTGLLLRILLTPNYPTNRATTCHRLTECHIGKEATTFYIALSQLITSTTVQDFALVGAAPIPIPAPCPLDFPPSPSIEVMPEH